MIFGFVAFAAMFPQDMAAAMKVVYLGRRCPWRAGVCELVTDWGALFSIGVTGGAAWHYRVSWTTAFILACLGAASVLGTVAGDRVSEGIA